jgi:hypothetical protein
LFVAGGRVAVKRDFRTPIADERMRAYLGADMTAAADAVI